MRITGLQKLTLLDYPGKVACIVFNGGCNLNCGYCHNYTQAVCSQPIMTFNDLVYFLQDKVNKLDGVVISGGEALVHYGEDFIEELEKIKSMGFLIKLDTNGMYPYSLRDLIHRGLIDYVAMDIKGSLSEYTKIIGINEVNRISDVPMSIKESISIIMNSDIDYEFRTTVIHPTHNDETFYDIRKRINGAKRYYLQQFKSTSLVRDKSLYSPTREELERYADLMKDYVEEVYIRGI